MNKDLLNRYSKILRNYMTDFKHNENLLKSPIIYNILDSVIDNILYERTFPQGLIDHIYRTFDGRIMEEKKLNKSLEYLENVVYGFESGVYINLHYNSSLSRRITSGLYLFIKSIDDKLVYTKVDTNPLEGVYHFGDDFKQRAIIVSETDLKDILFSEGLEFLFSDIYFEREDL